jgi:uncharacterized membrane protein (UPF0127 family)
MNIALVALLALSVTAVALTPVAFVPDAFAQDDTDAPITKAQPKLPTIPLTITHNGVKHVFTVEQATTPREQTVGLMFRTAIPADGGMLFDWGVTKESEMWMRNCPVPEDMVFIDPDGTIHHIAENTVPQSMAIVSSEGPVQATLELQGGITSKLGIEVGDKVTGGPFGKAQ